MKTLSELSREMREARYRGASVWIIFACDNSTVQQCATILAFPVLVPRLRPFFCSPLTFMLRRFARSRVSFCSSAQSFRSYWNSSRHANSSYNRGYRTCERIIRNEGLETGATALVSLVIGQDIAITCLLLPCFRLIFGSRNFICFSTPSCRLVIAHRWIGHCLHRLKCYSSD